MNATATLSDLTKRELEVAEMLAFGASKKEIATKLFISERTVENHARSIYQKVGVSKVSELSTWFIGTKYNITNLSSPLLKKKHCCSCRVYRASVFGRYDVQNNQNRSFSSNRRGSII